MTDRGAPTDWRAMIDQAADRIGSHAPDLRYGRAMFVAHDGREAATAIAYARANDLDFGIVPHHQLTPALDDRLSEAGFARVDMRDGGLIPPAEAATRRPGRITVLTSGTTGVPKLVGHSWETLNTLARVKAPRAHTWFVPYQPGSYAWYQMACLGLFAESQHLHLSDPDALADSFAEALRAGVTAISSTPTFWRYMLLQLDPVMLRASRLASISLGGEIVDQAILDQLRDLYPDAAIRHIFASSEAGAAFVVSDGKAGFPRAYLDRTDGDVSIRIADGRLAIRSNFTAAAAEGAAATFVETGDLVEIVGERVLFRGREGGTVINVGGMKAMPTEIEAQLLLHPSVRWARVFARRAPLVGALAAAQVVLSADANRAEAEAQLSAFLRGALPEHAIPRFWEFLDRIPIKSSMKS